MKGYRAKENQRNIFKKKKLEEIDLRAAAGYHKLPDWKDEEDQYQDAGLPLTDELVDFSESSDSDSSKEIAVRI